jgi:hypothetical protein
VTIRPEPPSWIEMRKLVAIALVFLAGCSFFTARSANRPMTGCSRAPAYGDFGVAIASAALATYSIVSYKLDDCPGNEESGRCENQIAYKAGQFFGVTIGLLELIQGFYGLATARQCEANRARISGGT